MLQISTCLYIGLGFFDQSAEQRRVFNLNNITFEGKSLYCIVPEISLYSLSKTICGILVHLCGLSTGHLMPLWEIIGVGWSVF